MKTEQVQLKKSIATNQNILCFDGECMLCNKSVQWVIKQDKQQKIQFAALQSKFCETHLAQSIIQNSNSFVFISDGKLHQKSKAVLQLLSLLGGFWKLFLVFYVVPNFLRDAVYDFIARNRYDWFGKSDTCLIADKSLSQRILP